MFIKGQKQKMVLALCSAIYTKGQMKGYIYACYIISKTASKYSRGRRGHDGMVIGFTTTCAISAYHH